MQKEVEEKKKKSVEDIKIYKTYLDFICYIEMLTEKYPICRHEKYIICL